MKIWREKRRGGIVNAIGEEGGARRKQGRGKEERRRDGERRNGKDWAIDRERLVKAKSVHELTKNVCSILFLHRSLLLKNIVRKI